MNKKERIIEILSTIIDGIKYIKSNRESDYKFMSEISLEAIISVINEVKSSRKYDRKLYELIYIAKDNINNINKGIFTDLDNTCNETIDILRETIEIMENQLSRKLDIVFMPYNAYMWNSLESIWKSANEDENCNCYVVPIPYYKLISRDNGVTEQVFTYEGNMLPEYVPVLDYKSFDLEELNPDIIYIHNQYDDCNNATRVDSRYFSYNLKKYTGMLVYVAYAILGTCPVSLCKDFYSFISTRNFDKVVVQSEAFEIIAEYAGIKKSKLVPTGSPKFDALVNSLEKQEVSELYVNKFKGKTVLLWTTTLMKIINGRNRVLDEIEELFNLVKDNPDLGLIYRPHPLEFSYVESKANECFDRYMDLIRGAENTDNIIVDKNPNYYEAFKIADALISDKSSVLIEFMGTEKPVLIYDTGIERDYYNKNVFDIFSNYVVGEDDMTVEKFIDLVINKKDTRKKDRLDSLKTVLANLDGTCGEKTHKYIRDFTLGDTF